MSNPGALFAFGLLHMTLGVLMVWNARRFRARAIQVPGVVVGLVKSSDPDSRARRPIFRYTTLEGLELEVVSKWGEPNPPQPGERVTVYYDPKKHRNARIGTGGQSGFEMGWVIFGFGSLLTAVGVLSVSGIL